MQFFIENWCVFWVATHACLALSGLVHGWSWGWAQHLKHSRDNQYAIISTRFIPANHSSSYIPICTIKKLSCSHQCTVCLVASVKNKDDCMDSKIHFWFFDLISLLFIAQKAVKAQIIVNILGEMLPSSGKKQF